MAAEGGAISQVNVNVAVQFVLHDPGNAASAYFVALIEPAPGEFDMIAIDAAIPFDLASGRTGGFDALGNVVK